MLNQTNNKLIIAAAGSGKTNYIIEQSIAILQDNPNARILITTYTIENAEEIRKRFLKLHSYVPKNITIQTYFSFLIQHGARPYKFSAFKTDIVIEGMLPLDITKTVWGYTKEQKEFYLSGNKFYKDTISPFVLRCNEESDGAVIKRLEEIYTHIFIDEVQDLARHDLDFFKILLQSKMQILAVGDIRQNTYSTNGGNKNSGYKNIKDFVEKECKDLITPDEDTLKLSHRNNQEICDFANKLYPSLKATPSCSCLECKQGSDGHVGVFIIKASDKDAYLEKYKCTQLRYGKKTNINTGYEVYNFGECKGMTRDRVLIYPTKTIIPYLNNGKLTKIDTIKKGKHKGTKQTVNAFDIPKFYVAITRARHSVCIVIDDKHFDSNNEFIEGIIKHNLASTI